MAGSGCGGPAWIDSHCHVTADEFAEDRAAVLERATAAGLETLVAIGSGYGVEHNGRAVELAASDARVVAAVGVHPHDAARLDAEGREQLRRWLGAPRVVAVGECGLDYYYMNAPREVQCEVFAEQLAWARELELPVSIHVRDRGADAYEDLLALWKREGGLALEGVLHCYTHDLAFARRALDAGLWISFSGILTFKRDRGLRGVAAALPHDRVLVETDAPLLAPEGQRGRRNEPAYLPGVGEVLAATWRLPVPEVAERTTANARRLFRLAEG